MENTDNKAKIEPVRLGPDNRFKFKCHKNVQCFTKCCRGINIVLTPYDIIKLKNRLQLPSEQFLAIYTEPQLLEKQICPSSPLSFWMMSTVRVLLSGMKAVSFTRIVRPRVAIIRLALRL